MFFAGYSIVATSSIVNVTGNLQELLDDAAKNFATLTFFGLNVTTDNGPIVLNKLHIETFFQHGNVSRDLSNLPHVVNIASSTGDITVNGLLGPNPVVVTGGEIRSSTLVSTSPLFGCFTGVITDSALPGICGSVYVESTGRGRRVTMSQLLAGSTVTIKSNGGLIVGANAAVIVGTRLDIASNGGNIALNGFVQGYGNETYITSGGGNVAMSAVFGNRIYVDTGDAGKLSLVEVFLGLKSPGNLVLPVPDLYAPYGDPLFYGRTSRGGITVLGIANSPLDADFAGLMSVDLASDIGDVKVEVNGGGFAGRYDVSSARGRAVVELEGRVSDLTGYINNASSYGRNYIKLFSNAGDVQLSTLASAA